MTRHELHDEIADQVGSFEMQEVAGVVDHLEPASPDGKMVRSERGDLSTHAAVVGTVEVQEWLGRNRQGRVLGVGEVGTVELEPEAVAVEVERCREVVRRRHACNEVCDVIGCVVAG